jgi:hypothetical protein
MPSVTATQDQPRSTRPVQTVGTSERNRSRHDTSRASPTAAIPQPLSISRSAETRQHANLGWRLRMGRPALTRKVTASACRRSDDHQVLGKQEAGAGSLPVRRLATSCVRARPGDCPRRRKEVLPIQEMHSGSHRLTAEKRLGGSSPRVCSPQGAGVSPEKPELDRQRGSEPELDHREAMTAPPPLATHDLPATWRAHPSTETLLARPLNLASPPRIMHRYLSFARSRRLPPSPTPRRTDPNSPAIRAKTGDCTAPTAIRQDPHGTSPRARGSPSGAGAMRKRGAIAPRTQPSRLNSYGESRSRPSLAQFDPFATR